MTSLGDLRTDVRTRLGDLLSVIWTDEELDGHLVTAYKILANASGVFWDWTYLENLPRGFSYTAPWEKAYLDEMQGFDYGCANFTAEVDRRALGDERERLGPANHTSPFEATDEWLATVGASTAIPATADLPKTVTALDRVTWDNRVIDALQARTIASHDSRYELTAGEVNGYIWQKDGIRTLRKVRVPAAQADTHTITGHHGILRDVADLSDDTVTGTVDGAFDLDAFDAVTFEDDDVCWGSPRQIPGQHPTGTELFGLPRRPCREGKNVRVEHFRQGRALTTTADVCELPDRYALYLRDYTQGQCLARPSAGQDLPLSAHFLDRWKRGLARVARRCRVVETERISVLGGTPRMGSRPPRPSRPWPYGSRVR